MPAKGVERDLLIKRFIKNILYSKDHFQINLYYSGILTGSNNPVFSSGVGGEKETSVFPSESPQFVLSKMAPQPGLEPGTKRLTAAYSTIELLGSTASVPKRLNYKIIDVYSQLTPSDTAVLCQISKTFLYV